MALEVAELPRPRFHFHIVLLEPEIPPNTGNIGRLCVATQSTLHLVEPLGFSLEDKEVRRAGLDYWKFVDIKRHRNFEAWLTWREENHQDLPLFFFEVGSPQNFYETTVPSQAALIFGKETTGISPELLKRFQKQHFSLPMFSNRIRSLNLSNSVSLILYECIRQQQLRN